MFLDSLLGLPSQIISSTTGMLKDVTMGIIGIPGTIAGSIGDTIGKVSGDASQAVQGVANVAGQTVSNVASTATNFLSSPILIIGVGIVIVMLIKK